MIKVLNTTYLNLDN